MKYTTSTACAHQSSVGKKVKPTIAQRRLGAVSFVALERHKAKRRLSPIYSNEDYSPIWKKALFQEDEKKKAASYLESIRELLSGESGPRIVPIKNKSIIDRQRLRLPDWRYLPDGVKAHFEHLSLLNMEDDRHKLYNFTLHFKDEILDRAKRKPKPIDYLTRLLYRTINKPVIVCFEFGSFGRLHVHGSCLIESPQELRKTLCPIMSSETDAHEKHGLVITRNYHVCNWAGYLTKDASEIDGEKTLRCSRKITQIAKQLYDAVRPGIVLINTHNPRLHSEWRYKTYVEKGLRAAANDDDYFHWLKTRKPKPRKTKNRHQNGTETPPNNDKRLVPSIATMRLKMTHRRFSRELHVSSFIFGLAMVGAAFADSYPVPPDTYSRTQCGRILSKPHSWSTCDYHEKQRLEEHSGNSDAVPPNFSGQSQRAYRKLNSMRCCSTTMASVKPDP